MINTEIIGQTNKIIPPEVTGNISARAKPKVDMAEGEWVHTSYHGVDFDPDFPMPPDKLKYIKKGKPASVTKL